MMNKKTIIYLFIIFGSLMQLSCDKESDEELLNQRINGLVAAIEAHKEQSLKHYFSNDFSVDERLNQNNFFLFIRYHLKRNKNISISLLNKDIKLHETSADVTADVLLLGADGWLPDRGQQYYVESRWKKEKGTWVMSRLRWEKE